MEYISWTTGNNAKENRTYERKKAALDLIEFSFDANHSGEHSEQKFESKLSRGTIDCKCKNIYKL